MPKTFDVQICNFGASEESLSSVVLAFSPLMSFLQSQGEIAQKLLGLDMKILRREPMGASSTALTWFVERSVDEALYGVVEDNLPHLICRASPLQVAHGGTLKRIICIG